jgi:chromosome segregation ATPase
MNASNYQGDAEFAFTPESGTRNEEAVLALTKAQKLAASRLAIAQDVLDQARDFEAQLSTERSTIAGLLAAADAAQTGEREAAARIQHSRGKLESLTASRAETVRKHEKLRRAEDAAREALAAAEKRVILTRLALDAAAHACAEYQPEIAGVDDAERQTRSDLESALQSLEEFRRKRIEANASVEEFCARIERLSGSGGLSTEAIIRVVERRTADMLRHEARPAAT